MKKYYTKRRYIFFLVAYFLFAWFCLWAVFRLTDSAFVAGNVQNEEAFISQNLIKALVLALIIMIFPVSRFIRRRKKLK